MNTTSIIVRSSIAFRELNGVIGLESRWCGLLRMIELSGSPFGLELPNPLSQPQIPDSCSNTARNDEDWKVPQGRIT